MAESDRFDHLGRLWSARRAAVSRRAHRGARRGPPAAARRAPAHPRRAVRRDGPGPLHDRRADRPPSPPQARVALAAALGATHATVALTDLTGDVLAETEQEADLAVGPSIVLDGVADTATEHDA